MSDQNERFVCKQCGWVGEKHELTYIGEIVEHVCPQCKWVSNSLSAACHAYGCRLPAEAGEMWPDAVYRWSCHAHSRWMSDKRKEKYDTTATQRDQ